MELNFLTDYQIEEMQMMAEIINAMAIADGFQNLDACLARHPKRLNIYNRYAAIALRAIQKVQGHSMQTCCDKYN